MWLMRLTIKKQITKPICIKKSRNHFPKELNINDKKENT